MDSRFAIDQPNAEEQRRAALANWLADDRNVLLWRSIVNRVWHYHFGRGIVGTPNDLAEWVSGRATRSYSTGWRTNSARAVTSEMAAPDDHDEFYRQGRHTTQTTPSAVDNRLLWRMNRRRLDAESYRDSVLQLAGNMDWRMGGPSDRQFNMSKGVHVTPTLDYIGFDPDAAANHRRSVYRFVFARS